MPSQKEIHLPTIHVHRLVLGRLTPKDLPWPVTLPVNFENFFPRYQWMPSEMTWLKTGEQICQDGWDLIAWENRIEPFVFVVEKQPTHLFKNKRQSKRVIFFNFPKDRSEWNHHLPEQSGRCPHIPPRSPLASCVKGSWEIHLTQRKPLESWDMLVLMEDEKIRFPARDFQGKSYQILVHTT